MKLTVSTIAKSYDKRPVLRDCSYAFHAPGTYVLMGPNGSGKSTFLRVCALLETPDSGTIVYQNNDVIMDHDIPLKRMLTLVLPRTGVFNSTVYKNVAYGLHVRGLHRAAIDRKVDEALAFVGLGQKAYQHARTLSSGETQRLGIARALAIEPQILFLDEPTASIDQENTEIIESIILRMKEDRKTMVIMTTHDLDQAGKLADKLLAIRGGKIVES